MNAPTTEISKTLATGIYLFIFSLLATYTFLVCLQSKQLLQIDHIDFLIYQKKGKTTILVIFDD